MSPGYPPFPPPTLPYSALFPSISLPSLLTPFLRFSLLPSRPPLPFLSLPSPISLSSLSLLLPSLPSLPLPYPPFNRPSCSQLDYDREEVLLAVGWLHDDGWLYTTITAEHFKSTAGGGVGSAEGILEAMIHF